MRSDRVPTSVIRLRRSCLSSTKPTDMVVGLKCACSLCVCVAAQSLLMRCWLGSSLSAIAHICTFHRTRTNSGQGDLCEHPDGDAARAGQALINVLFTRSNVAPPKYHPQEQQHAYPHAYPAYHRPSFVPTHPDTALYAYTPSRVVQTLVSAMRGPHSHSPSLPIQPCLHAGCRILTLDDGRDCISIVLRHGALATLPTVPL